jgi:hypothetical protein
MGGGSHRAAAWLAWSAWALCVVLLALTALLDYSYTPQLSDLTDKGNSNVYQFFAAPSLVYTTVGAFVASRRPRNLVGWLLYLVGFVFTLDGFGVAYADYALLAEPAFPLPGGEYMACISQTLVVLPIFISLAALLILLFPDGRLPDRNLRAVPWLVVIGGLASALWAVTVDSVFRRYSVLNPIHVEGALGDAVDGFGRLGAVTILISLVIAIIVVFVRLGSARGAEHQQLKWFAYAAAVPLGIVVIAPWILWYAPLWVSFPLGIVGLSAIPVAVGIAVLRHRLYDIDHIINRTLVYGALTALLAAGYLGTIVALHAIGNLAFQVPVRAISGQEQPSQLVVVASTLIIAALFNPLRRRIQSFIDRRFYRRKYDARKTLEEFSVKLREETDLDSLNEDLVGVVRETMQPAHVSLWLRPETARGRERA